MEKLNILMKNYKAAIATLAKAEEEEKETKKAYCTENSRIFSKANEKILKMKEIKALRELKSKLEDLSKETKEKYIRWTLDYTGPIENGWDIDFEDPELDEILSPFVDKIEKMVDSIEKEIKKFLDKAYEEFLNTEYDVSKEKEMEEASLRVQRLKGEVEKAKAEIIGSPSFPLTQNEMGKVFGEISEIRDWNQKKNTPEFEVDEDGDITISFIAFDEVDVTFEEPTRYLSWLDEYDEAIDDICDDFTEGVGKVLPKNRFVVAVEACDVSDYDVVAGDENEDGDYYGDCEIAIDVPVKIMIIKKNKEEK